MEALRKSEEAIRVAAQKQKIVLAMKWNSALLIDSGLPKI